MPELHVHDLGRVGYDAALEMQKKLLDRVKAGGPDAPDYLLLLEHDPPVITLGRRGKDSDILQSRQSLQALGIEVRSSTRGGEVTYHGPGQLVLYAIRRLHPPGRGVRDHVRGLEEAVIRTLAEFGVEGVRGESRAGTTGVWTRPACASAGGDSPGRPGELEKVGEKIAAVGVAVHRWVTYHGVALNVCTDLSRFGLIVPCGLADKGVTSLSRVLGKDLSVEEIKPRIVEHFAAVFGYDFSLLC
ncbi:MAG: lipoyl(octanoyl) transferase LipB [Phycisphaerae bacterium]|nr:lipoyl(octanoyl) transferase LipB [Phycisphaerae bacterium]